MPKPVQRVGVMASPSSSTPQSSCRIGVTNCSSPMVTRGTRRAAAANSSRGTAVTMPDEASSSGCAGACSRKVVAPLSSSQISTPTAIGASTAVSAVRLCRASRLAPSRFFISP